ncbi:MAG: hypothetical protein E6J80_05125 [Deltaproteobacteria bacterium]|nr:MAG: hypothetical protein E6J80_05125 [Deltaproteobacteria bacterium]
MWPRPERDCNIGGQPPACHLTQQHPIVRRPYRRRVTVHQLVVFRQHLSRVDALRHAQGFHELKQISRNLTHARPSLLVKVRYGFYRERVRDATLIWYSTSI